MISDKVKGTMWNKFLKAYFVDEMDTVIKEYNTLSLF